MTSEPVIACIAQEFPYLTETFVYREVIALRQHGVRVVTLSNHRASIDELPAEARDMVASTYYILPVNILKLLAAHLYFILRRPRAYFPTLMLIFTETSRKPDIWLQNIKHFVGAVYLAYQIRDQHITHIHAHFSTNPASFALYISTLFGIGFSFTVHNYIFWKRLLLNSKLKRADFIACISEYSRDALLGYAPEADREKISPKLHIVHCGVNPQDFHIDDPVRHTPPVILCAAQFEARKGMPYLIEACHVLKKRGVDVQCILAGDGRQYEELAALIKKLELDDRVRLIGAYFQDQMTDLFRQADLFVLPCIITDSGDRDGIPVVLMEAMAAGIPVISTRVSGIPELIDHMQNGILVEQRDPEALADAITLLLNDEALYATFREQARRKIQQAFDLHTSADLLIRLLLEHR